VGAAPAPLHLLAFGEALADYCIHRGLRQAGGNALAVAVSLAVVDQAGGIAPDVDGELMGGMVELAKMRIVQCQPVHVAFDEPDPLVGTILVVVPEQSVDPFEGLQQTLTGGLVMMGDSARLLFEHRRAHRDMQPVQHVLGRRGNLLGQHSDLLAAMGQEGDILIGLQAVAHEHVEQPALRLAIVAMHQTDITGVAIVRLASDVAPSNRRPEASTARCRY
jgi:hypothetical protein